MMTMTRDGEPAACVDCESYTWCDLLGVGICDLRYWDEVARMYGAPPHPVGVARCVVEECAEPCDRFEET